MTEKAAQILKSSGKQSEAAELDAYLASTDASMALNPLQPLHTTVTDWPFLSISRGIFEGLISGGDGHADGASIDPLESSIHAPAGGVIGGDGQLLGDWAGSKIYSTFCFRQSLLSPSCWLCLSSGNKSDEEAPKDENIIDDPSTGESGWGIEEVELKMPDVLEEEDASTGEAYHLPTVGVEPSAIWVRHSLLAADHATVGSFEMAMQVCSHLIPMIFPLSAPPPSSCNHQFCAIEAAFSLIL